MVRRFYLQARIALIVFFAGIAPAFADSCSLKRLASIDMNDASGALLVPADLNGRSSQLLVDTGAPLSILDRKLADEMALARRAIDKDTWIDFAGTSFRQAAIVPALTLGTLTARDVAFLESTRWTHSGADGTFGAGFLANYDVELDFTHKKLNLFVQNQCDGSAAYWARQATVLPMRLDFALHVFVDVTLDGQPLVALIDTGSTETILSLTEARLRFGIDPVAEHKAPDGAFQTGTGSGLPFFHHRFGSLALGNLEIRNTELTLSEDKLASFYRSAKRVEDQPDWNKVIKPDLILGLHHLSRLRLYLGYGKHLVYLTPVDAS